MQVDYEPATIPEILNHMNENLLVVLQIETALAVEIREELLAVPGIDAVLIGPVDLSISLGCPGDFMNPKMVDAMEAVRDTCNRRGIAPGTQTRNLTLSKFWRDRGMRFLGCSSETGMLLERATELVNALR
jgi:2-keto-3-deoxy-L-rhamnonate aldolase RhmA